MDTSGVAMPAFPLEGVVVLDLGQIYNAPYTTYLMALAGAVIIKVEPPGGEPLRRRSVVGGAALPFAMLNGCKLSIQLDLKSTDGKTAFKALAETSDVLVENFSPGTMERLGLASEILQSINPRLIYASSSGYGRAGPYSGYSAMDLTIQAMSGVMQVTGFPDRPPVKAGPAIADFIAGTHLYGAIATALYEREISGVARRVEVSMQDAIYATLSSSLGLQWAASISSPPPRTGNRHGGLAESPYNVYATANGFIAVICTSDSHWASLVSVMGQPELAQDPRFNSLAARVDRMEQVDAMVTSWTSENSTEDVFELLMKGGIPCAPVRTLEQVINDENMHARGTLQWIDHPKYGRIVVQQSPLQYDGVPPFPLQPSHELGADTEAVLRSHTNLDEAVINRIAMAVSRG
jgi:formyl-CoA transferase